MTIYSVYVINRAGGLIYQMDHTQPKTEVEKTFSYPLELTLKIYDERVVVSFGQRDGIKAPRKPDGLMVRVMDCKVKGQWIDSHVDPDFKQPEEGKKIQVGHTILGINGDTVRGRQLEDGRDVLEVIANPDNYPIAIKFGRPKLSTNERIMLASMFHSLYAIGCQLSPAQKSSGIQVLETDSFKLHCLQTLSGIKLIVLADPRQGGVDVLLRKIYEVYADFALKNPFYSIDMPIRCDLFDTNLQGVLEASERLGMYSTGM